MTKDDYCINVCKAKCCRLWDESKTCPKLGPDCKCTIYKERFGPDSPEEQVVGFYSSKSADDDGHLMLKAFVCSRITKLIENKLLPEWVEKGCCYAHPELLEDQNHGS